MALPHRKWLNHSTPDWINDQDEVFFITLCCLERGSKQLTVPDIAEALIQSVQFKQERHDWYFLCLVLMPDHMHGIVSLPHDAKSLTQQVRDWKRFTKREYGIRWQKGFFEHRLRSPQSRQEKYNYILNNPVRAGLCENAGDWPHKWVP